MKKLLLLFFALLQSVCIFADTVEIDGIYYNLIEKGNIAEVTKSPQGYSGDIVIQESISYSNNKYSVIGIGDNAFKSSSITSIYIPSSIKEIKEGAFGLCEDLTAVKISNLESWCYITFGEGSNPLAYAKHLFVNGQEVTDLDIPEGITELKTSVFANFSSLKSVTIPSSVVTIGGGAFSGCINLKTISIPNSVTSIGDGTFRDCISLKKISIPNSVTNIGSSAFENCKGLESVSLPNGLKKIKTYSFQNCTTLKTIKIPSSVESIWPCAFKDCKNLESVELSESLTEMESEEQNKVAMYLMNYINLEK